MYLSQDKSNSGSHSICLTTPHKVAKEDISNKKIDVSKQNSMVNRVESMKSNIFQFLVSLILRIDLSIYSFILFLSACHSIVCSTLNTNCLFL